MSETTIDHMRGVVRRHRAARLAAEATAELARAERDSARTRARQAEARAAVAEAKAHTAVTRTAEAEARAAHAHSEVDRLNRQAARDAADRARFDENRVTPVRVAGEVPLW